MDVLRINIKTGDDILVKYLLKEEVDVVFGYPGGAIMPIYNTLHSYSENIVHILTRHEQGAIHAAQGYARISKKFGVCISTSGPGATNFITGLADANIDSTPVLCICGQVSSTFLGKNSFQETNIIDISFPISKWNVQILLTQDIGITLQKAFFIINQGRNAPVLIDFTKDAQLKRASIKEAQYIVELYKIDNFCPITKFNSSSLEKFRNLIKMSKKPFILVGQGIVLSKAEKELKKLIEKADLPFASTILAIDSMDSTNTLFMGMLGMHGGYATNLLTNQCDVLVAIGMRFDDRVTGNINRYACKAKIIHIDIDPCEIDKIVYCHLFVIGDSKQILPLITENIRKTTKKIWVDIFYHIKKCEENIIIKDLYPENKMISMGEVIKQINIYKDKDAILITDVGQHQMISLRYFSFSYRKSKITSGGLGTMGFSLPAAIGAQLSCRERQVICIVGDGGFQMTLQEFGTILQNKLPIKMILLNNNFLGMVRQWQELFFERKYAFTELINPDFIQIAKSYKIVSKKILNRRFLEKEIKEMFQNTRAYFLDIAVEKEENVFPMISTATSVDEIRLN